MAAANLKWDMNLGSLEARMKKDSPSAEFCIERVDAQGGWDVPEYVLTVRGVELLRTSDLMAAMKRANDYNRNKA